jgi:hypothetical protein
MLAYQRYFDNFFGTLRISRVNFKHLGANVLLAVREAQPGPSFAPCLAELEAAVNGFDVHLTEAGGATSGSTEAFRAARKTWLAFVDDTMKDYVTPRLRKRPEYADFLLYTKSKLARLDQAQLLQQSKLLLALYRQHQAALQYPALLADAHATYQQLVHADEARTIGEAIIDAARVAVPGDWQRLARALRRVKAQLEAHYDEPAEVYRFFDFGKTTRRTPGSKALKAPVAA